MLSPLHRPASPWQPGKYNSMQGFSSSRTRQISAALSLAFKISWTLECHLGQWASTHSLPSDKNSSVVFGPLSSYDIIFDCENNYIKAMTKFRPTGQYSWSHFLTYLAYSQEININSLVACLWLEASLLHKKVYFKKIAESNATIMMRYQN